MKKERILPFLIFMSLVACKKDKPTVDEPVADAVEVYLQPTYNNSNYQINQVIQSPLGYRYYFSDIKIVGTNVGNGTNELKDAFLFDYAETGALITNGNGTPSLFGNLTFNVGVPSPLNTADPSLPPATSVLNITNIGDMHWGWNPGYKFVTIEGKADTIADGIDNFDHSFFFHLGTDALLRSKTISTVDWTKVNDNKYKTILKLDIAKILDDPMNSTDLRVNFASHSTSGQMAYSTVIMDQFVAAIKK